MTGESADELIKRLPAGVIPLKDYFEAIRKADQRLQEEIDRRYKEVGEEQSKALKIKEEGDAKALDLARRIDDYKDEKSNNWREQNKDERANLATKDELRLMQEKFEAVNSPVLSWIETQKGGKASLSAAWVWMIGAVGCFGIVGTFLIAAASLVFYIIYNRKP